MKHSKYAEYYAYFWLLLEKKDMLGSVESSLDKDSAATMTSVPKVGPARSSCCLYVYLFSMCVACNPKKASNLPFFSSIFRPRRRRLGVAKARVERRAARAAEFPKAPRLLSA